jgi:hypothetical protein
VTDDEPTNEADLTLPPPKAQVFVLRVWREAGEAAAPLRLRLVPAGNDAAPRYFSSWQALAEWGERADDEPGRQPRSSQGET